MREFLERLKIAWYVVWIFIPRVLGVIFGVIWFHFRLSVNAFIDAFKDSNL